MFPVLEGPSTCYFQVLLIFRIFPRHEPQTSNLELVNITWKPVNLKTCKPFKIWRVAGCFIRFRPGRIEDSAEYAEGWVNLWIKY